MAKLFHYQYTVQTNIMAHTTYGVNLRVADGVVYPSSSDAPPSWSPAGDSAKPLAQKVHLELHAHALKSARLSNATIAPASIRAAGSKAGKNKHPDMEPTRASRCKELLVLCAAAIAAHGNSLI